MAFEVAHTAQLQETLVDRVFFRRRREACENIVDAQTGEVIAATVRAHYELEREQAEAATRLARALNDAKLQDQMTSSVDDAWRYRETDLWRELVQRTEALQVALRAPRQVHDAVLGVDKHRGGPPSFPQFQVQLGRRRGARPAGPSGPCRGAPLGPGEVPGQGRLERPRQGGRAGR